MGTLELSVTANALVVALCLDYPRRKCEIMKGRLSRRTDIEFRYINSKMYDAAAEIVGEELAELYIKEIGEKIGYAYSSVEDVSEVTYKINKRKVKEGIARRLYLAE
jgi:hypothetical protein